MLLSRGGTVKASPTQTSELCSYGCENRAKFRFRNGKVCCSETIKKCSAHRKLVGLKVQEQNPTKSTQLIPFNPTSLLLLQKCSNGCGQSAITYRPSGKWFCSEFNSQCPINAKKVSIGSKGRTGGYREGSGNGKSGWYKEIWCNSSYELAWVIFHLEHGTVFERCKDEFKYFYKGKEHTYHPDFKVHGYWIEIKGYSDLKWTAKQSQFPFPDKLIVLFKKDIPDIFKYVESKYGKDFTYLYENVESKICKTCNNPFTKSAPCTSMILYTSGYCSSSCRALHRGVKPRQTKGFHIETSEICDHGCARLARFQFYHSKKL